VLAPTPALSSRVCAGDLAGRDLCRNLRHLRQRRGSLAEFPGRQQAVRRGAAGLEGAAGSGQSVRSERFRLRGFGGSARRSKGACAGSSRTTPRIWAGRWRRSGRTGCCGSRKCRSTRWIRWCAAPARCNRVRWRVPPRCDCIPTWPRNWAWPGGSRSKCARTARRSICRWCWMTAWPRAAPGFRPGTNASVALGPSVGPVTIQ
jgi:hypothetical protein